MRPRTMTLVLTLLVLSATARAIAERDSRRYVETHGSRRQVVVYDVTPTADGFEVSSVGETSAEKARWVAGSGLVSWDQHDPGAGNELRAVRTGNVIHVTGTLKGKPVSRDVRFDAAPWYQIFGPGIADLLPAGALAREFWVIDPSDLAPHKMLVRRAGPETVTVDGRSVEAVRVHFSPAGVLAGLWGADFWYRVSDGAWVYSRLPENGGLTITTIQEQGR